MVGGRAGPCPQQRVPGQPASIEWLRSRRWPADARHDLRDADVQHFAAVGPLGVAGRYGRRFRSVLLDDRHDGCRVMTLPGVQPVFVVGRSRTG